MNLISLEFYLDSTKKFDDMFGQTFVQTVPRVGDEVCLKCPNEPYEDYVVTRVSHMFDLTYEKPESVNQVAIYIRKKVDV